MQQSCSIILVSDIELITIINSVSIKHILIKELHILSNISAFIANILFLRQYRFGLIRRMILYQERILLYNAGQLI